MSHAPSSHARLRNHLLLGAGFALLLMSAAGCFLLSPDADPPTSQVAIRIMAKPPVASPNAFPCPSAADLLTRDSSLLRANAIVFEVEGEGEDETRRVILARPLDVGELEGGGRTLTGDLNIPVGPRGVRYEVDVRLFYLGDEGSDPVGRYDGRFTLDTGIVVSVDDLTITEGKNADSYAGTVRVSFDDESTQATFDEDEISFDQEANRVVVEWRTDELIEWNDDPEDLRRPVVQLVAEFQPTLIFRGKLELDELVAGASPAEQVVTLVPPNDPPLVGHRLRGRLNVFFEDARPPSETGIVTLSRQQNACDQ